MEEIVTILSTREWAIAIWGTGFFVWMLTQREIRKSLWNVIKILLGKKLRHFFLIIALYVAGITMIFYQLPFWNNIYLKDIILWLIFSGISYCVNSIIKGDAEHLKSTVKDNFKMKTIRVVAAVIKAVKEDGRTMIFATQRGYGEFKGGWEFPGGKIEAGETPQEALKREIMEELDTEVAVGEWIETVEYDYPGFHLSMDCFWCEIVKGDLVLKEHEAARWLTREELADVEWLPADVAVAEKIEEEMD